MNGIVININPVALEIGGFALRWYSLAIMLAVVTAVVIASREARAKGLSAADIYGLLPWVLLAGLFGARLFHVLDRWDYYGGNLLQVFQFQQGGLAIWGGLVAGGVATIIYARIKKIPLSRLLDVLVPALLVAQIVGRLGCIVNGDAFGAATSLPWGFIYTHPSALIPPHLSGILTHPYPVYEMLWNVAALILLYRFRGHFRNDGLLFLTYLAHYSLVRFVLTFVREENIILGGLQQAQILAIFGFIVSIVLFIYLKIKVRHREIAACGV